VLIKAPLLCSGSEGFVSPEHSVASASDDYDDWKECDHCSTLYGDMVPASGLSAATSILYLLDLETAADAPGR
jgi:hypothetical protein